ncbi:hypothetical protein NLI96_g13155 [Meripilus lineatus]|uniref:Uncharacterized protein n=1 Tax=Meripilus lineatus TaxID=2056292 RepID=A0AAD5Y7J8_9APHY|nr:hypothetical protein NLI96_g13155 [Physisporinus lineatus]
MTLSDPDPFASAGIPFSPQILDPNRLSVYSDTSLLDPSSSKRSDIVFTNNRISYGSSSSNSHGHHSDLPTARSHLHPPLPTSGPGQVLRRTSDSCVPLRRHARQMSGDNDDASMVLPQNHFMSHTRGTPTKPSGGSASSQSTLTQHDNRQNKQSATLPSRHDEFPPVPRSSPPTIRARGMTVAGVVHNPRRPSTAAGALEFSSQASSRIGGIRTTPRDTLSIPSPANSSTTPSSFSPITHTHRTRTSSFNNNINRSDSATATSPVSINGTRPLVLVRKASSPRVAMPPPPATPPSSGLPPPPSSPGSQSFIDSVDDLSSLVFPNHDRPSSSSSSLSFASDAGIDFARGVELDLDIDRGDEIYSLMRDSFVDSELRGIVPTPPQSPPATIRNVNIGSPPSAKSSLSLATRMHPGDSAHPRLLKKAVSQQNMLGKRFSGNSIASSIMSGSGSGGEEFAGTLGMGMGMSAKVPRKQRSFHHPRIPLPPLPSLRHSSSTNNSPEVSTASSSQSQAHSHSEHKKGSVSSPPTSTRKRLFSGSSSTRRSSSSQPPASPTSLVDEDIRSIISIDRDGGSETSHDVIFEPREPSYGERCVGVGVVGGGCTESWFCPAATPTKGLDRSIDNVKFDFDYGVDFGVVT